MSSQYPAQIDNGITLPPVTDNLSGVNAATFNNLRGAIIQIEATLGVSPQGVYGNVANRLITLEGIISNLPTSDFTAGGDLSGTATSQKVIGIYGRPISSFAPTVGQVLEWDGIAWTPAFPPAGVGYVITLSGPPTFLEFGQTLVNPLFNATYSQTPVIATIQSVDSDNVVGPLQNVFTAPPPSVPPNIFTYEEQYTDSSPPAPYSVTFTLTSSNGNTTSTATTTTTWGQNLYYGVGAPGGNTAAFILGLSNSTLSTSRVITFTVDAGVGQSIYFAYRTAYGVADFWAYGWEGGFTLISTTISLTNDYGFTEDYTLYQSEQTDLGVTTINVF